MSDDIRVRAARLAVRLRTWGHRHEASLMEDLAEEVGALRATIEDRDDALLRAGGDNLRLGRIVERVQELADTYGYTPNMTSAHHEIADQITRAIYGAPDPRRVETAEELDAVPTGQRNMWGSFSDDCECIHCKPMDSESWHGKASS